MTRPLQHWQVLPHGKLTEIAPNILTVTGLIAMPLADLPRRMTVVRLRDGRLVIFSAIALDEDEMQALERYGQPAFLVVPNGHHRLDAKIWKERYPAMQVVAPAGAASSVGKIVPVDTTAPDFGDAGVQFIAVPGTREQEAALLVHTDDGSTLVLNDLVGNIHDASGFGGWVLRRAGFAGDTPRIPAVVKLSMVADKEALRAQLLQWAEVDSLKHILVSHGASIDHAPQDTLRDLAESLA